MSDDELQQTLTRAQRAIEIIRETIRPYGEAFSPEERAVLRRLLALPGPRIMELPGLQSDVGRIYEQVQLLRAQTQGVEELLSLQVQLADLELDVYAALLTQVSLRYGVPLSVQQSLALMLAN